MTAFYCENQNIFELITSRTMISWTIFGNRARNKVLDKKKWKAKFGDRDGKLPKNHLFWKPGCTQSILIDVLKINLKNRNPSIISSCSRPCGGGFLQKTRICLYPPCTGKSFQLTNEKCNSQTCEVKHNGDCFYGNGFMYRGKNSEPVFSSKYDEENYYKGLAWN